ncbi:MAG: hypothetical protein LBL48_08620 [Azoarcus sp.]|nr:hypothetical protein [Azoarcus sp.]
MSRGSAAAGIRLSWIPALAAMRGYRGRDTRRAEVAHLALFHRLAAAGYL